MSKVFYTLHEALDHLKFRITGLETKMKAAKSDVEKIGIERQIEWIFERGLNIISFSKPGEIDPATIDWFLGRQKERPDIKRLEEKLIREEHGKENHS